MFGRRINSLPAGPFEGLRRARLTGYLRLAPEFRIFQRRDGFCHMITLFLPACSESLPATALADLGKVRVGPVRPVMHRPRRHGATPGVLCHQEQLAVKADQHRGSRLEALGHQPLLAQANQLAKALHLPRVGPGSKYPGVAQVGLHHRKISCTG